VATARNMAAYMMLAAKRQSVNQNSKKLAAESVAMLVMEHRIAQWNKKETAMYGICGST
jgi:hypothetical protein